MRVRNSILQRGFGSELNASTAAFSSSQIQMDSLIGGFSAQAGDFGSLIAMSAGSLGFSLTRSLASPLLSTLFRSASFIRASSWGMALVGEVTAFRSMSHLLNSPLTPTLSPGERVSGRTGEGGWIFGQAWLGTLTDFLCLKGVGHFLSGENILLRQFSQSLGMVAGEISTERLHLREETNQSLSQRFIHASVMSLAMEAGAHLTQMASGGRLEALEQNLHSEAQPSIQGPSLSRENILPILDHSLCPALPADMRLEAEENNSSISYMKSRRRITTSVETWARRHLPREVSKIPRKFSAITVGAELRRLFFSHHPNEINWSENFFRSASIRDKYRALQFLCGESRFIILKPPEFLHARRLRNWVGEYGCSHEVGVFIVSFEEEQEKLRLIFVLGGRNSVSIQEVASQLHVASSWVLDHSHPQSSSGNSGWVLPSMGGKKLGGDLPNILNQVQILKRCGVEEGEIVQTVMSHYGGSLYIARLSKTDTMIDIYTGFTKQGKYAHQEPYYTALPDIQEWCAKRGVAVRFFQVPLEWVREARVVPVSTTNLRVRPLLFSAYNRQLNSYGVHLNPLVNINWNPEDWKHLRPNKRSLGFDFFFPSGISPL